MTVESQSLGSSILKYLTTAPTSNFVEQPVEMIDHWQGRENLLWRVESRGRDAVLKLFLDAGQARSRRQYDGQQIFARAGLAPRPLWFDRYPEGLARQLLVYEWAPGATPDAADAQHVAAHALTSAQIHRHDPAEVRRFSPSPVNLATFWQIQTGTFATLDRWPALAAVHNLQSWLSTLCSAATSKVASAPGSWQQSMPTPVHGDLRWENAAMHLDHLLLLDWEMFGLGDPALEVASFLAQARPALGAELSALWRQQYVATAAEDDLAPRITLYEELLTVRNLGYLLNGLHQLGNQANTEVVDMDALQEITVGAARIAAATIELDATPALSGIRTLFGRLSSPE